MAGTYDLWLTDNLGYRLLSLDNVPSFAVSRMKNGIGAFEMVAPVGLDVSYLGVDRMLQVWRASQASKSKLWRVYFLRRWRFEMADDGSQYVMMAGPDCCDLLCRRIVAAFSGTSQSSKTDYADDMMKEVVREAIADGIAPAPDAGTRVWDNLSVEGDVSAGPILTKEFAFQPLFTTSGGGVLGDLAAAAREAGTPVYFDVVPSVVTSTSIAFEFRTYTGQPGMDVTGLGLLFDPARGNLKGASLEYDYTEEVNYVYAGGQGEGLDRNVRQVYDEARYSASAWNRCEGFADATDQDTDNGVREAGRVALGAGRPKITFGGVPIDTRHSRFGRDWDFGYKVRARFHDQEFDSIVSTVAITVDENGESIQARLEYEG